MVITEAIFEYFAIYTLQSHPLFNNYLVLRTPSPKMSTYANWHRSQPYEALFLVISFLSREDLV